MALRELPEGNLRGFGHVPCFPKFTEYLACRSGTGKFLHNSLRLAFGTYSGFPGFSALLDGKVRMAFTRRKTFHSFCPRPVARYLDSTPRSFPWHPNIIRMNAPDIRSLISPAYESWKLYIRDMGEEDNIKNIELSIQMGDFLDNSFFSIHPLLSWLPVDLVLWIAVEYFKAFNDADASLVEWLSDDTLTRHILSFFTNVNISKQLDRLNQTDYANAISYCRERINALFPSLACSPLGEAIISDGLDQGTIARLVNEIQLLVPISGVRE